LAVLEHGEARVFELTLAATFVPRQLKDIGTAEDAIVAAILHGDHAVVPRGDDRIGPGDRILVFSTREAADRVRAYFMRDTP
jgi:Trk K+ transport system NAD-binding subunit